MQEEISHEYKAEVARLKLLHSGVPEVLGEPVKAVEISGTPRSWHQPMKMTLCDRKAAYLWRRVRHATV